MNLDAVTELESLAPLLQGELEASGLSAERIGVHCEYLACAVGTGRAQIYGDFIVWQRTLDHQHARDAAEVERELDHLSRSLGSRASRPLVELCTAALEAARTAVTDTAIESESVLQDGMPHVELARDYLERLFVGDRRGAMTPLLDAVEAGLSIEDLYLDVLQPCQWEIGRLWQCNQLGVGQEHFCTAVSQTVMARLYPRIFATESRGRRVVTSSVNGELHEIGVRMVADIMELNGWDTYYLGSDTPPETAVESVASQNAEIFAISVTRSVNLPAAARLIDRLRQRGDLGHVKVIVGGNAFNGSEGVWNDLGADGWAPDARAAIQTMKRLLDG